MSEEPSGGFRQDILKFGALQVVNAMDEVFNHCDDNLPMWGETGDRSVNIRFSFDEPFAEQPAVTVGLVGIDADQAHNLRFNLSAQNITETGFELHFVTWDDTRIARASISWQAIGKALGYPEEEQTPLVARPKPTPPRPKAKARSASSKRR